MQRRRLWCHWYFLPMRTEDHFWLKWKLTPDKFAEEPKRAQKGRQTRPFCVLCGFNEMSLTLLERMAGTTRLELPNSPAGVTTCYYTAPLAPSTCIRHPRESRLD